MNDPDQHRDKRQRTGDEMDLDDTALPTNHERQPDEKAPKGNAPEAQDTSMQDTSSDPLDELEKDMGEPFLLCGSSKALYMFTVLSTVY
jgi:hypothetical protein